MVMQQPKRAVDGVVLIDKIPGVTSHDVVEKFRRRSQIKKVGHTGTLDPLATGLLVLCVGKATRLQAYGGEKQLTMEEVELQRPFSERALRPMIERLGALLSRVGMTGMAEHDQRDRDGAPPVERRQVARGGLARGELRSKGHEERRNGEGRGNKAGAPPTVFATRRTPRAPRRATRVARFPRESSSSPCRRVCVARRSCLSSRCR